MRMVTKLNRKSLRAQEKSGHHDVPGRNQEVTRVVHSACLCVKCQHSHLGACRTPILTTVQQFGQRMSHHPIARVTSSAVTNSKDTTIKLHSAHCCKLTSFVQCNPSRSRYSSTNSKPMYDFHKLHWSWLWFRHQVGGVYVRTHLLRDEPFFGLEACCIHKFCMSTCFALPRPLQLTKHIVAVASRCRFKPTYNAQVVRHAPDS